MALTENERTLIRFETGDTETTLPDGIMDILFDKAAADYSTYSRKVWLQVILVKRYRNLVATYRKDVSYKQNQTSENLSDIAKGYAEDLAKAEAMLDDMISSESSFAYMAATRRIPSREKDQP